MPASKEGGTRSRGVSASGLVENLCKPAPSCCSSRSSHSLFLASNPCEAPAPSLKRSSEHALFQASVPSGHDADDPTGCQRVLVLFKDDNTTLLFNSDFLKLV